MPLDVTLVLFRTEPDEIRRIFAEWERRRAEYDNLRVLLSGSAESVKFAAKLAAGNSGIDLISRYDNLGFATGHNLLLARAFESGASHALVANPDLTFDARALGNFFDAIDDLEEISLVGPLLERLTETYSLTGEIDSLGIRWDPWGRHFDVMQGEPVPQLSTIEQQRVSGVSGACLMVSQRAYSSVVSRCGYFFDDYYLAYREDAELGIRSARIGVSSIIVPIQGIGHVRTVRGSQRGKTLQDLLGVRNRFLLKYNLGKFRPGNALLASLRDLMVAIAALSIERRSFPGLVSAWRIRRAARSRGRRCRALQPWTDGPHIYPTTYTKATQFQ